MTHVYEQITLIYQMINKHVIKTDREKTVRNNKIARLFIDYEFKITFIYFEYTNKYLVFVGAYVFS